MHKGPTTGERAAGGGMVWIIAAVMVVAVALFFLARRAENKTMEQTALPYQKTEALFSPAERSFFGVLQEAVGKDAAVLGKVRVADVMAPKAGLSRSGRQTALNKISSKHFDFLLCGRTDLAAICAIELDDASHSAGGRHPRDEFLRKACEAAGIPLIRVPAATGYPVDDLKRLLAPYLGGMDTPYKEHLKAPAPRKSKTNGKVCPTCSAAMVRRVALKGTYAGKTYWACSTFPKCKTVEAVASN
jgi:hypothetical protein